MMPVSLIAAIDSDVAAGRRINGRAGGARRPGPERNALILQGLRKVQPDGNRRKIASIDASQALGGVREGIVPIAARSPQIEACEAAETASFRRLRRQN